MTKLQHTILSGKFSERFSIKGAGFSTVLYGHESQNNTSTNWRGDGHASKRVYMQKKRIEFERLREEGGREKGEFTFNNDFACKGVVLSHR